MPKNKTVYQYEVTDINGQKQSMERFKGKVLLIVNVASQCGFTPQYLGLQQLYDQYRGQGFEILAFPCNQFKQQEPGDEASIKTFCEKTYQVKFPLFAKIKVNGDDTHPLYGFLKQQQPGLLGTQAIKWNFTKFLVDREGTVVQRYASVVKPENIAKDINKFL